MVTVPFAQIPQNLRIPLFWAEIDPSQANTNQQNQRSLIIGQQLAGANASTVISGALSAGSSTATLTFASTPAGIKAGMFAVDTTTAAAIPVGTRVSAVGATTVTLDATATGALTADVIVFADLTPKLVQSTKQAADLYGVGSMIVDMVDKYRRNDRFGEMWTLGLLDAAAGTAASGHLTVSGAATIGGTIPLYINGILIPVAVTTDMTPTEIGEAIEANVNGATDPSSRNLLPLTANNVAGTVTFTARHKGLSGNDIDIRLAYYGNVAGEMVPAGLTILIVPMSGGATNPSNLLVQVLNAMSDTPFDFIAFPYSDANSLNAIRDFLDDISGRWSWSRQIYGHAFSASRGSLGSLVTLGTSRNDQHTTIMGYDDSPSPSWNWAAALTGACAASIKADPGRPLHNIPLAGIFAPPIDSRFTAGDRNSLVWDGISVFDALQDGTVETNLVITTYQVNPSGQPDNSYLKVETMALLWFILRFLRARVTSKFSRMKLADNGTNVPAYSNIVTPNVIRSDQIAAYRDMVNPLGWVQADKAFIKALAVQRDPNNPNRVNVLWPGVLINQLDVFALLAQFRLQPDTDPTALGNAA